MLEVTKGKLEGLENQLREDIPQIQELNAQKQAIYQHVNNSQTLNHSSLNPNQIDSQ